MNALLEFLKGKQVKRFMWTTIGGFLGLIVIFLQSPEVADYWYAPFLIALITSATKEINNKFGGVRHNK